MSNKVKFVILILVVLFFTLSCREMLNTFVRFRNDSATTTVDAIWDGLREATLAPGNLSEYMEVNPGTHTIQFKETGTGKVLTNLGWPNLVQGTYTTFSCDAD